MEAMDFMDPSLRRRHNTMLYIGYGLIAVAILLLTVILMFVAYGFGLQNGRVILNGLVFVSSNPSSAEVYLDGARYRNNTNTQIVLPAATYDLVLKRSGYREWERRITVTGGAVQSYTYPFLFPVALTASTKHEYAAAPALVTESPDRHWLLVEQVGSLTAFDLYDLTQPTKAPTVIALPANLVTIGTSQAMQVVEWSDDNNHVLLKHIFDTKVEYLLLNRSQPEQSQNLDTVLTLAQTGIDLRLSNKKADQFIIYDTATHALSRASLSSPIHVPYLSNVLSFMTYGDNTVLYATPDPSSAKKVLIDLYDGNTVYPIRQVATGTTYLLNLTAYSGDLYVAVSAASENAEYVYKNPIDQINNKSLGVAVPVQAFTLKAPNYLAFSTSAQYIAFESGTHLAVYDAENDSGSTYTVPDAMDKPQTHVAWMDNARLVYVSGGQLVAFDYDGQNRQDLISADARYLPEFDQQYKLMYALVPSAANNAQEVLTSTSLRTPADQ